MSETANLRLPLVQASQAQKHVTVNEALAQLDAMAQLSVVSRTQVAPPGEAPDGTAFIVPGSALDVWADRAGQVAVFSNGGWTFLAARPGWRAWVQDTGRVAMFDGAAWLDGAVAISPAGAASVLEVVETDVALTAGATVLSGDIIPARSTVLGVSGIVTAEIGGSLATWRVGVPGATGRYGTGIGLALGAWVEGMSGQPQAYYADTPLAIEAEGGDFASGSVRLAVHLFRMQVPRV